MLKKLIYILYVVVLIVMGAATFIERVQDTDFVHAKVYGAWWFCALWGILALVGGAYYAIYLSKCPSLKGRKTCLLLHIAFLVILGGALQTHLYGFGGMIHLRENMRQNEMVVRENGDYYIKQLPFEVELDNFQVVKDSQTGMPIDFVTKFTIYRVGTNDHKQVSMNKIAKYYKYRFYQSSYDDDGRGSILAINHDSYGITITYIGYAMLFFAFGLMLRKQHFRWWQILVVVSLALAWCLNYFVLDGSWKQIPILRHPILGFHVSTIILAYVMFLLMTIKSGYYLITRKEEYHDASLLLSLAFLSVGIFVGAIWANISWGTYWNWDAKETWALITLMIYAVPAHRRLLPWLRSYRSYHIYMILAFLTILMTYFGVNYFLTGMHSYA